MCLLIKVNRTEDLPTSNSLHWEIPKREGLTWSVLYQEVQTIADSYQVIIFIQRSKNFEICNLSLEEILIMC
jgi:hypothetical protein